MTKEEMETKCLKEGLAVDPVEAKLKIAVYERAISQLFKRRTYEGIIPDYVLDHWFPLTKNIKDQEEAG